VHLLPIYDEYVVAYRDRGAVPHLPPAKAPGVRLFVNFQHALVIGGKIEGTWRTTRSARAVRVDVYPLRRLTGAERRTLAVAVDGYERFLSVPVISEHRPADSRRLRRPTS
jgi:hypothetical protein